MSEDYLCIGLEMPKNRGDCPLNNPSPCGRGKLHGEIFTLSITLNRARSQTTDP